MEDEILKLLAFPTERHERYLLHAARIGLDEGVFIALEGSLLQRTATPYSEIRLIGVGHLERQILEKLIGTYARPVMTLVTPKGIYSVLYEDGLSVEWDLRPAFYREEMKLIQIIAGEGSYPMTETLSPCTQIHSLLFPTRNDAYRVLYLLERAIAKNLAGDEGVAGEFLAEAVNAFESMGLTPLSHRSFLPTVDTLFKAVAPLARADQAFLEILQSRLDLIAEKGK
ncbi:MAG TPA: hypothetical protein VHR47_13420 [Bacillota bacterium]|nr:hypothetical protein [Bacillota bacterium]